MIPPSCRVVRDGTLTTIPAAELVKGDVVLIVSTTLTTQGIVTEFLSYTTAVW